MHFGDSGVRLAGLLVPFVFAASMAVPHQGELPLGIHEALGCSGSGPTVPGVGGSAAALPGWLSLSAAEAREPGAALPVGTDGFVVLTGSWYGLAPEQALAGIQFIVTNSVGEVVPGTIAPLGDSVANFGWTASKPLPVGARLSASLSATPATDPASVTHTYTLEVAGAPPEPTFAVEGVDWTENYKGTGGSVDCRIAEGCSSYVAALPSSYEVDGGYVNLHFGGKPTSGVAWEVMIIQSVTHPDSTLSDPSSAFVTGPNSAFFRPARVRFGVGANQACALVIVRDLRTGKQVSAESCADKQPATVFSTSSALDNCIDPPNEALRDLWCRVRGGVSSICNGAIPTEGMPNEDKPQDPGTSNGTTAQNDIAHESSGCQFGRSSASAAWLLPLVGLAFAALGRRRRQAANRC